MNTDKKAPEAVLPERSVRSTKGDAGQSESKVKSSLRNPCPSVFICGSALHTYR